jgi:hypothetical protein
MSQFWRNLENVKVKNDVGDFCFITDYYLTARKVQI